MKMKNVFGEEFIERSYELWYTVDAETRYTKDSENYREYEDTFIMYANEKEVEPPKDGRFDGSMIQEIRKLSGLNKKEFSEKYEIPYRTLCDWEDGKRKPPEYVAKMLKRIVSEDSCK